ncbi:uncharacterized protein LOC124371108 [Homalodisca vitripennis]|uniref:uncharacterized protein LOC124371108 n=1 Tax=Homalodisca vitripennis TaxID=197043 RepID=UPI001EEAF612|nr:uncharacterized protein LOC124371108 [Homalodisca vitripennis]
MGVQLYYTPAPKRKKIKCRFTASAKKGTFFESAHLPLTDIFCIVASILCLVPPRQDYLKKNFNISSKTAVDWYSFCREVFVDHVANNDVTLGGVGHIVEIDEAKFGKRKYNRGRLIEGQWVFGGIDRTTHETFLVPVEKRDKETLLKVIKEKIEPGSTIISDCWRAYDCLEDEGFVHETVNHSKEFVDPRTHAHTNTIERTWRSVKDKIPRYGRKKTHFVGYLGEYLFKAKYPNLNERIHHFWVAAAKLYPPEH